MFYLQIYFAKAQFFLSFTCVHPKTFYYFRGGESYCYHKALDSWTWFWWCLCFQEI